MDGTTKAGALVIAGGIGLFLHGELLQKNAYTSAAEAAVGILLVLAGAAIIILPKLKVLPI